MLLNFSQAIIEWYREIYRQVTEWGQRVAFPSKIPIFFSGLIIIHGLVEYGLLAIFITHLTDDWGVILPKAAKVVNIHEGLSSMLIIVVAQLSDSCVGRLSVILFTNTAFILGLGVLWFEAQRLNVKVLYGALALLTLGKAGRDITLKAFLADQLWRSKEEPKHENDEEQHPEARGKLSWIASTIRRNPRRKPINFEEDEELIETRRKLFWRFNWIIGIILATLWLSNKEWDLLVQVSTMAMVVGFFLFLLGIPFYERKNTSRPLMIVYVFKVAKAALSKGHLAYPTSPNQLFKNYTSDTEILPHIAFLRWLDKAAIVEPSPPCRVQPTEQETTGRLYEVAKVNEVKRLISMLPLWSTFFVYTLVDATSSTFFYEQAKYMDDHLGIIDHVPIVVFVIISTFTSSIISILTPLLKNKTDARRPPLNRIRLGMYCSVLCCLVAWRVEIRRLHNVKVQRVEDNVEVDISLISVFWLTPQFFLVGLIDGLCSSGLQDFFESQVPESMSLYGPQFSEFATGIGKFFNAICILIFRSWFKEDVNTSRLDKYYAMLMVPTFLNFCFCCSVSYWYANQNIEPVDIAQELEDATNEVLTNENSGLTPSTS